MTIKYFGKNIEEERKQPEAQIWYNEDSQKEEKRMDKIIEILVAMGWECVGEYGVTYISLPFGRDEYSQLVEDYKEAKKMAR